MSSENNVGGGVGGGEDRNQQRGNWQQLAGLAHDLRNLVTVLIWSLERVRKARTPEERLQALKWVPTTVDRVKRLAETSGFQTTGLPVAGIVRAVQALRSNLPDNINLVVKTPLELPSVRFTETEIERLVFNIGSNAVQAMAETGGRITIQAWRYGVEAHHDVAKVLTPGRYVVVCVKDSGPGISTEMQVRLFGLFSTGRKEGTGVGLAWVKEMLESKGGGIRWGTVLGKGTWFSLYMPVAAS